MNDKGYAQALDRLHKKLLKLSKPRTLAELRKMVKRWKKVTIANWNGKPCEALLPLSRKDYPRPPVFLVKENKILTGHTSTAEIALWHAMNRTFEHMRDPEVFGAQYAKLAEQARLSMYLHCYAELPPTQQLWVCQILFLRYTQKIGRIPVDNFSQMTPADFTTGFLYASDLRFCDWDETDALLGPVFDKAGWTYKARTRVPINTPKYLDLSAFGCESDAQVGYQVTLHDVPGSRSGRNSFPLLELFSGASRVKPFKTVLKIAKERFDDTDPGLLTDYQADKIEDQSPGALLPQALLGAGLDLEQVTELDPGERYQRFTYEVDGEKVDLVCPEVTIGSYTYQVVLAPDLDADDVMTAVAVEQMVDGFDDCYGACWLKDKLGIEVESIKSKFKDLDDSMQQSYRAWCAEVVRLDGWARIVGTYDGSKNTGVLQVADVKLEGFEPAFTTVGYAVWRSG